MKTTVLLFTALLMSLTTVSASEIHTDKKGKHLDKTNRYRSAQPIMFVERGVEFLIFSDGSFDFNTYTNNNYYNDSYYRSNSKRGHVNMTYGTRNKTVKYTSRYGNGNRGVSVSHDRDGKIRRIGNVYLNYDRYGKLKRAGSIYMHYSHGHHSALNKVGGMHIKYNRRGEIINTHGQINRNSDYCNFCGASSCSADHSYRNRQHDDYEWYDNDDVYHNDDNYYYYKQNGKVKKSKKRKH